MRQIIEGSFLPDQTENTLETINSKLGEAINAKIISIPIRNDVPINHKLVSSMALLFQMGLENTSDPKPSLDYLEDQIWKYLGIQGFDVSKKTGNEVQSNNSRVIRKDTPKNHPGISDSRRTTFKGKGDRHVDERARNNT